MKFIPVVIITFSKKEFHIIKVVFDDKAMLKTLEQSYLKSKHTNNENKNGDVRTISKKFDKQIEGILGEIAIEKYIEKICNKINKELGVKIHRYDDIRTDSFKSPKGEYDIKIVINEEEIIIEARASINYKFALTKETLEYIDTLGTYINPKKSTEKKSDFYIRPLFQLKQPNENININDISILDYILDDKIELYLTGGCNTEMMFGSLSKEKTMGQSNTIYQTLAISKGWDMQELTEHLRGKICNERGASR